MNSILSLRAQNHVELSTKAIQGPKLGGGRSREVPGAAATGTPIHSASYVTHGRAHLVW